MSNLLFSFARSQGVFLATDDAGGEALCVRPDTRPQAVVEACRVLGKTLPVVTLDKAAFDARLASLYADSGLGAAAAADDLGQAINLAELADAVSPVTDLLDQTDDAPVIRIVNAMLSEAVREQVSDIHIEPEEGRSVVRFRRDGDLYEVLSSHLGLHAAMVSRLKVLAQLDIAEKRLPQDGRIAIRLAGKPVDIRLSTLPTGHGERVVLRLLDKDLSRLSLERLGMAADTLAQFDALLKVPHGIVLVSGPTGSGKTTTLYGALLRIAQRTRNIMTVEDPVEYDIAGISQIAVNSKVDLTFARALRAILRQDPDVIMIGEIRDLETAQIAIQASLTGHLVLATVHTNDAASAVTRLVDMGVEPYLLASSLVGVLAQRLMRQLCPTCKTPDPLPRENGSGEPKGSKPYRPVGCDACRRTGYQGRTGVFELLPVDDGIRRLIHERAAEAQIRDDARSRLKARSLRDDGWHWVADGLTSREELLRTTADR